ncbi:MAG: DUF1934 domain-containing protein [Ruminococcus sp.]|nr:DUF1934 domain-containing protein [Ruminococcus sp.]
MKVRVSVKSEVGGEVFENETVGEYMAQNGEHHLAYSDLSGNMITNNYLTIGPDCLHIRREGGFEGEMLFDPMLDTVMKYRTIILEHGFMLHTYEYSLTEHEGGLTIRVRYGLNDGKAEEISNQQTITIKYTEEKKNG